MPKPPLDHFGLLSPIYERVIRTPEAAEVSALLELARGQVLLDVGGGTGRVTQLLQGSGARLLLLDPSWGMLQQAQRKGCCGIAQGTAERLPFGDGCLERIVAVDSFHHFWNHAAAAKELVRVLAPGGRLVIEEFDVRRFAVRLVALGEKLAWMRSRFFAPEELAALFRAPEVSVRLHCPQKSHVYWAIVEKRE